MQEEGARKEEKKDANSVPQLRCVHASECIIKDAVWSGPRGISRLKVTGVIFSPVVLLLTPGRAPLPRGEKDIKIINHRQPFPPSDFMQLMRFVCGECRVLVDSGRFWSLFILISPVKYRGSAGHPFPAYLPPFPGVRPGQV